MFSPKFADPNRVWLNRFAHFLSFLFLFVEHYIGTLVFCLFSWFRFSSFISLFMSLLHFSLVVLICSFIHSIIAHLTCRDHVVLNAIFNFLHFSVIYLVLHVLPLAPTHVIICLSNVCLCSQSPPHCIISIASHYYNIVFFRRPTSFSHFLHTKVKTFLCLFSFYFLELFSLPQVLLHSLFSN